MVSIEPGKSRDFLWLPGKPGIVPNRLKNREMVIEFFILGVAPLIINFSVAKYLWKNVCMNIERFYPLYSSRVPFHNIC